MNRNFLVIIIIAPELIGGLGLPSIETQQIIEAIDLILSLYNSPFLAKYLLRKSLELLQLESGSINPVLKENYEKYKGLITRSWIQSVWE